MSSALFDSLPGGFEQWPSAWQVAALFFSTFILEDVAAVGAGILLANGVFAWPTAFLPCFLGIWIGDAALYGVARGLGRHWFERSSWRGFSRRLESSERWFAREGSSVLIFSRLLPGARLPTYLVAGFLRVPLRRFLLITGSASFIWTIIILVLTQLAGAAVLGWLSVLHGTVWPLVLTAGLLLAAVHFLRLVMRSRSQLWTRLGRWRHWEFWPPWFFYSPVALYCLWLAVRHRGLTLPTLANPGIFTGGIIGESKMATLQQLMASSPEFTADAELIAGSTPEARLKSVAEICERHGFHFPVIFKPDVGQRGLGVKLIRGEDDGRVYLRATSAPVLVQRYDPGPFEVGVFYYRFPHEARGQIFAITEKIFPFITGDGCSTILQLVWNDLRARFMAETYFRRLSTRCNQVLAAGEKLKLVETGNHAQGCIFRDGMHLWTPALAERIDEISRGLREFYIGRYDIRYSNEDDLRAGKNFKIIELNGAASEATSIYDARNSIVTAYRTLFQQWDLVFAIGAANRRRGCANTGLALVWQQWCEYRRKAKCYPAAD